MDSERHLPERRPYFPTYSQTFPIWMQNETICEEFIRLFARNGQPTKLLSKPQREQVINIGKGIRGVRFDIVSETQDYHIYCMESQRIFIQKSNTDRTLFYGCVAMASKSLKENEDFDKLRPVTVIFIYIDNTSTNEPIEVMNIYRKKDIELSKGQIRPYNDKLTFIDINLNNKANCEFDSPLDSDIRAFMDIMSNGDDEQLVKLILQDPDLSDSTRNAIEIFSELMKDVIRKTSINEEQYTPYLHEILKKEEFIMTTRQLIKQEGIDETLSEVAKDMLIEGDSIDKIVRITKLPIDKIEELKDKLIEKGKLIQF